MNCPEIPVADKLAYPPIQVTEPNQRYAAILLQDLSAVRGEITACRLRYSECVCMLN